MISEYMGFISLLKEIFYFFTRFFPDKSYLRLRYFIVMRRGLNLKHPQLFTEKLQWLKLNDRNPQYSKLVDKYEVKTWVVEKIGNEHVIPTIGVYDSFGDIDFKTLPQRFVMKCTHNSGGSIICKNKDVFNIEKAKADIEKQLKKEYYYRCREWPYKNIKPRIIIEEYLDSKDNNLKDYKFYCFNGVPKCLFVTKDRPDDVKLNFYDLSFQKMPIKYVYPDYDDVDAKPECWDKMLEIAGILSKGIPFVRVDLYEENKKIFFGEMTFFPTGGFGMFEPKEWDKTFGNWLKLPITNEEN